MFVLGIAGRMRSGKDTFAHTFKEEWTNLILKDGDPYRGMNYPVLLMKFADPIRDALVGMDPLLQANRNGLAFNAVSLVNALNSRLGDWEALKQDYPMVRTLMQSYGDSVLEHDDMFFTNIMFKKINKIPEQYPIVISDVRRQHEVDVINDSEYGHVIRLIRPDGPKESHHTEEGVDNLTGVKDYTFNDIEAVKSQAKTYARNIFYSLAAKEL